MLQKRFTKTYLVVVLVGGALLVGCTGDMSEKHWKLAQQYASQGQSLRAIEEYTRVVNLGQRNELTARAQLQIAKMYEENLKDFPRAIRAYVGAIQRSQEDSIKLHAHWAIARIYFEQLGDASFAADEYKVVYEKYAKHDVSGPEVLLAWAKSLMDAGRFSEAAERYKEFRKNYSGHKSGPRTVLEEGQAYLADRRSDEAAAEFRDFLKNFSGVKEYDSMVAEAYFGLGSALEIGGDLNAALEAYRQSLSTYPNKKVIELKIEGVLRRKKEKKL